MVTCCSRCNTYKGNKTLKEAGLKLLTKPKEPTIFSNIIYDEVETIWNNYTESFNSI